MASIPGDNLNNTLFSSNDPTDTINGFLGIDTVNYALATSAVNVSLSISGPQNTGGSGVDTLISIENITGSNFSDTLQGNSGNNVLNGGLGNDFVSYSSAAGSVSINLSSGVVTGAAGSDTLISIENAIGSNFADTIVGGIGNNIIVSGAGNDNISASLGSDVIDGGSEIDTVNYSTLTGPITLGAFGVVTKSPGVTDQLIGIEVIVATNSSQDTIDLSLATAPTAVSTTVNLAGTSNNVQVNLSSAPTINLTVLQFENVIGSGVADTITGNNLANNLSGNGGNDSIDGGGGNDTINGGGNNDTIIGGIGNDSLTGGANNDFFAFGEIGSTNRDFITDFSAAEDTILLRNSLDTGLPGALLTGINGLFANGTAFGSVLSATKFFFSANIAFTGANFLDPAGIYVNTSTGNIYYNDSTALGSSIFATVTPSVAATLSHADFVYAA